MDEEDSQWIALGRLLTLAVLVVIHIRPEGVAVVREVVLEMADLAVMRGCMAQAVAAVLLAPDILAATMELRQAVMVERATWAGPVELAQLQVALPRLARQHLGLAAAAVVVAGLMLPGTELAQMAEICICNTQTQAFSFTLAAAVVAKASELITPTTALAMAASVAELVAPTTHQVEMG